MHGLEQENSRLYERVRGCGDGGEDWTVDVTPLSHPVNAGNYFRELSELGGCAGGGEGEDDSLLSELLSPLEIRPDY